MQEHVLTGRIIGLVVMTVPEFGTRASFSIINGLIQNTFAWLLSRTRSAGPGSHPFCA